jgi:plasmid stabilization system protein ParE
MRQINFTPLAQAELFDALEWYAEHAPPVVPRLRTELRGLLSKAADAPMQFPPGLRNTRRAVLRHFPYVVIFRATDEAIDVIAFFHTSRDPVRLRSRV